MSPFEPTVLAPVTRSFTRLGVVPFWMMMLPPVYCTGTPRSQRPRVAVSVPAGLVDPAGGALEVVEVDGAREAQGQRPRCA